MLKKEGHLKSMLESLLRSQGICREKYSMMERFKRDFFESQEPLTEVMLKIDEHTYVRMDNLDFADKDYMFVN
jgi:hypothetical protein